MPDKLSLHPATIAANANGYFDSQSGGVVPPIQSSTTYVRDRNNDLVNPANSYARDHIEAMRLAEQIIAKLDHAKEALLFPSGMAAIAALFRTLPSGASVIVQSGIYWGTSKWISEFCERRGITLHLIDASDSDALETLCAAQNADLMWIETPSNPWLKVTDIAHAAKCAKAAGALLAVDSTAATPVLTRALDHGADIVMHSATKGMNGHSDVLAGVLTTNATDAPVWEAIKTDRHDAGAVLGAFEAWLLVRGLRTLPLRVERMSQNALALGKHLSNHPNVADVFYPGLPNHPAHNIAAHQMQGGFGSLLSFLVKGSKEDALRVAGKLNLFHRATSLGGVESLVEHRHSVEPHTGIPETLLRVSVGIEAIEDLIADVDQALG